MVQGLVPELVDMETEDKLPQVIIVSVHRVGTDVSYNKDSPPRSRIMGARGDELGGSHLDCEVNGVYGMYEKPNGKRICAQWRWPSNVCAYFTDNTSNMHK